MQSATRKAKRHTKREIKPENDFLKTLAFSFLEESKGRERKEVKKIYSKHFKRWEDNCMFHNAQKHKLTFLNRDKFKTFLIDLKPMLKDVGFDKERVKAYVRSINIIEGNPIVRFINYLKAA